MQLKHSLIGVRFPAALTLSVGLHAWLLWGVALAPDRPARLRISLGVISVEAAPAIASVERPATRLPEEKPDAKPAEAVATAKSLPTPEQAQPSELGPIAERGPETIPSPQEQKAPAQPPKPEARPSQETAKSMPEPASPPASKDARVDKTAAPAQPAGSPSAARAQGVFARAEIVGEQRPAYPLEALRRGIQGRVVLWLRISALGQVVEARIEQSSGSSILDESAWYFVWRARWLPARQGSTPVSSERQLGVRYYLVD